MWLHQIISDKAAICFGLFAGLNGSLLSANKDLTCKADKTGIVAVRS